MGTHPLGLCRGSTATPPTSTGTSLTSRRCCMTRGSWRLPTAGPSRCGHRAPLWGALSTPSSACGWLGWGVSSFRAGAQTLPIWALPSSPLFTALHPDGNAARAPDSLAPGERKLLSGWSLQGSATTSCCSDRGVNPGLLPSACNPYQRSYPESPPCLTSLHFQMCLSPLPALYIGAVTCCRVSFLPLPVVALRSAIHLVSPADLRRRILRRCCRGHSALRLAGLGRPGRCFPELDQAKGVAHPVRDVVECCRPGVSYQQLGHLCCFFPRLEVFTAQKMRIPTRPPHPARSERELSACGRLRKSGLSSPTRSRGLPRGQPWEMSSCTTTG